MTKTERKAFKKLLTGIAQIYRDYVNKNDIQQSLKQVDKLKHHVVSSTSLDAVNSVIQLGMDMFKKDESILVQELCSYLKKEVPDEDDLL